MKVLISHSYFLNLDPKEAANRKPYPPLAPLYLAALIKQELNIDCQFYDVMFDNDESGLVETINRFQPDVFILYDDDFNFLTKMCLESMRRTVFKMMEKVEQPALFLAHGSDASDQAEDYLKHGFDYVIHRNPERVIIDILNNMIANQPVEQRHELPSLSYLNNGQIVHNPHNRKQLDPNKVPMPAWPKIDIQPYRDMWLSNQGYFSVNISTSHGCPFRCNWCAKPLYGRSYKARPPKFIAEEFAYLSRELRADHVWVTDDIFALKPGWISAFADHLEAKNVRIPYKIQSRADLMTEGHVAELARSGCNEVWLGVESGSQKILDAMGKDTRLRDIFQANTTLKRHGIKVGFFLQYGYPGEELEDIHKTLHLIRTCLPDHIGISVSYPLKGTPFYDKVVESMGEKKNWTDSGDLALMYPGKFHPDFYRALHQYTHHYFGFVSLFRRQTLKRRLRRMAGQYRHIPGMIKYKYLMNRYREAPAG
ncbi:MAG: radical SAM protein [Caldithrix sp.]|nr:radical SAM protein [Caldithrix sp.]